MSDQKNNCIEIEAKINIFSNPLGSIRIKLHKKEDICLLFLREDSPWKIFEKNIVKYGVSQSRKKSSFWFIKFVKMGNDIDFIDFAWTITDIFVLKFNTEEDAFYWKLKYD